MKQVIIYTICMGTLLSSCNIYKKYNRPDVDMEGLYRDPVSVNDTLVSDTTNMGNLPWEEVFTDPQLQKLIRQGCACHWGGCCLRNFRVYAKGG